MTYKAVMRCPNCKSCDTSVKLDYSQSAMRAGEYASVESVWTCENCGKKFVPLSRPSHEVVLMCGQCALPQPHRFDKLSKGTWTNAKSEDCGNAMVTGVAAFELWKCCTCGESRIFGAINASKAGS